MCISGCEQEGRPDLDSVNVLPHGEPPSYAQVAAAQNERIALVKRYWVSHTFRLEWEEDGETRVESGEGNLVFIPPNQVALTLSKLGEILFWAGCDAERYWLFVGGGDSEAYIARNENAFHPRCEALPLPIHPHDLIELMGLMPFPTEVTNFTELPGVSVDLQRDIAESLIDPFDVQWVYDADRTLWSFTLEGNTAMRRIFIDSDTLLPLRVELLAPNGVTGELDLLVASDLTKYVQLEVRNLGVSTEPLVPGRMWVAFASGEASLRITAPEPRDETYRGPIKSKLFDFNTVKGSLRPRNIVVLDANCPTPAISQ